MGTRLRFVRLPLLLLLCSCGGGDGGDATGPTGSIGITLGSSTVTLTQGGTETVLVSVSRAGGFTGSVSLSLAGAPSGVTGSFSPAPVPSGSTQSSLTLEAAGGATPGRHALTVRGSGAGCADRTASLTLVVQMTPAYTLSLPASTSLEQGGTVEATVTIQRTSFAGAVSLSATGAPAGLGTSFSPSPATGGSTTLRLDATGNPAPGAYTLTVTGQAQGLANRTASITVTITPRPFTIQSPGDRTAPVGQPFTLAFTASGPGTLSFSSVGAPLPGGLTLDGATGAIGGAPTVDALLAGTPAGRWGGIIIEASNGSQSARTDPFAIEVTGVTLPAPYAYMPFDGSSLDDVLGLTGTAIGSVTPAQPGAIGEAVRVSGTDSRIVYPTALGSRLNGHAGLTFVTTLSTTSSGTMFFGLSDATSLYSRAYAGLVAGVPEFGGRSAPFQSESFQDAFGTTTVNDGQFHTVMGVLDLPGDRIAIYVDGLQNVSRSVAFTRDTFESITPASDGNVIGHITGYADSTLAPDIRNDEVALWDVALDGYQAATLRWLILTGRSTRSWIGF